MSRPLIAIVGLIYVLVSIDSATKGNVGLSIMYARGQPEAPPHSFSLTAGSSVAA